MIGIAKVDELRDRYGITVKHYDKHNLIAVKPGGMLTVRNEKFPNSLQDCISGVIGTEAAPLHRLDYNTSGLVVAGLTRKGRAVSAQFERGEVSKLYLALVDGYDHSNVPYMDIPVPISHDYTANLAFVDTENGRESRTECRVLAEGVKHDEKKLTLVLAKIHTGRTHHIRVHFASSGFPVHGDKKYNKKAGEDDAQLLHSACIRLVLPIFGRQETFMSIPSWIPEGLQGLVEHELQDHIGRKTLR